jgi:RNA polymerase sigma-70 factor (ECF subfamily)
MGEGGYSVVDKQSVHYLGIPLRVSYDWLSYRGLSAYGSVGVTMHIPILGKRDTNYTFDWQTVYTESAHFAPSLQWQVGVGLGVQYRFAPHTSIFAEPTFNWFIPSAGETRTVWSERPVMFTCPFGIRITW